MKMDSTRIRLVRKSGSRSQCIEENQYSYIVTEETPLRHSSFHTDLLTKCMSIFQKQPDAPLKLAIARLRLILNQPQEALRLFKEIFGTTQRLEHKTVALIGMIHAAYNLQDHEQLYTFLRLSRDFDYPDITYVQGLYGQETNKIANLFSEATTDLMLRAHNEGSDRASVYLAEQFIEAEKPFDEIEKLLSDLVRREDPVALRWMHTAKIKLGRSKEDFLRAHQYLDRALLATKHGEINHHLAIKEKISLDYDVAFVDADRLGLTESFVAERLNKLKLFLNHQLQEEGSFFSVVEGLEETDSRARDVEVDLTGVIEQIERIGSSKTLTAVVAPEELGWAFYSLARIVSKDAGYGFVTYSTEKELKYLAKAHELGNLWASSDFAWRLRQADINRSDQAIAVLNDTLAQFTTAAEIQQDAYALAVMWNNLGVIYSEMERSRAIAEKQKEAYEKSIEVMKIGQIEGAYQWPYANLARLTFFPEQGLEQDLITASQLFRKAVEYGEPDFWIDLLEMFPNQVPENKNQAEEMLLEVAKTGKFEALLDAGWLRAYSTSKADLQKSLTHFLVCSALCEDTKDQERAIDDAEKIQRKLSSGAVAEARRAAQEWQMQAILAIANHKLQDVDTKPEKIKRSNDFGNFYGLLIANANYDELANLTTPHRDVNAISELLSQRYGFSNEILIDADRREITRAFNRLRDTLKPQDNLIIYFAGHGIQESNEGFWLPVDAHSDDDFNWIANSYVTRKLREIAANNILVVADSCFSGTLTRDANIVGSKSAKSIALDQYDFFYRKKTRMAITSGGIEPVWDGGGADGHSIFAAAFINALDGHVGPISATEIFQRLREPVLRNSLALGSPQTPVLHAIPLSDHVDPDVVLVGNNLAE